MSIQQKEFSRFIKLLNDNECLEHVILVGSWAEYVYQETGVLTGFAKQERCGSGTSTENKSWCKSTGTEAYGYNCT